MKTTKAGHPDRLRPSRLRPGRLLLAGALALGIGAASASYAIGAGSPAGPPASELAGLPASDPVEQPASDPPGQAVDRDPAGSARPAGGAQATPGPTASPTPPTTPPGGPAGPASPAASAPEPPPGVERLMRQLGQLPPLDETGAAAPDESPSLVAIAPGAGSSGGSFADPSTRARFDIDLFEQNIRDALAGRGNVGYTYAIGRNGQLYRQDAYGRARTSADAPVTAQSATKPMVVASISKPITAMVALRLFAQQGISVDDPIGPWLPATWQRGTGVDEITFADLMTHRSGLRQSYELATGKNGKVTSAYDNIRIAVAQDVGDTSYRYANMNFGIFRLIVPKILGYDYSPQYDNPPPGVLPGYFNQLTGMIFHDHVAQVLGSVGVSGGCLNWDPQAPTILYRHPHGGLSGWDTGPSVLGCGGYGFYLSANGLTSFLSHLRYTEQLVSDSSRELMYERRLGLRSYPGQQGDYLGHDGVWGSNGRGMYGCVMSFHIHVDVSLLVNNPRTGDDPQPCSLLRSAFDAAWTS